MRLINDKDISVIRPQLAKVVKARQPYPYEVSHITQERQKSIKETRSGNEVLNDDMSWSQGGSYQPSLLVDEGYTSSVAVSGGSVGNNGLKGEETSVRSGDEIVGGIKSDSSTPDAIKLIRDLIEKAKGYPTLARRRGIEGTVYISFRIGNDGNPYDIKVINGSGSSILDNATIEIIKRAGPFPYIDKVIELPISFRLNEG